MGLFDFLKAPKKMFRKILDTAKEGDNVGLLLRGLSKSDIGRGDRLVK